MAPSELPRNIRDPEESCSQYALGPDFFYVDEALDYVKSENSVYVPVKDSEQLLEGDLIFYTDITGECVSHVGLVNHEGKVVSKFYKETIVIVHELWSDDIPPTWQYEAYFQFRKK
jgi:hypothetical protein